MHDGLPDTILLPFGSRKLWSRDGQTVDNLTRCITLQHDHVLLYKEELSGGGSAGSGWRRNIAKPAFPALKMDPRVVLQICSWIMSTEIVFG